MVSAQQPWASLSTASKRSVITTYITAGLRDGKTVTSLYTQAVASGFGIRKTDFLAIGRNVKGGQEAANRFQSLRRDYKMSEAAMGVPQYPLRSAFRWTVEAQETSALTGVTTTRFGYIYSPTNLTRAQVETEAESQLGAAKEAYGESTVAMKIINVLRRG